MSAHPIPLDIATIMAARLRGESAVAIGARLGVSGSTIEKRVAELCKPCAECARLRDELERARAAYLLLEDAMLSFMGAQA